jgi:hypothetical protein
MLPPSRNHSLRNSRMHRMTEAVREGVKPLIRHCEAVGLAEAISPLRGIASPEYRLAMTVV